MPDFGLGNIFGSLIGGAFNIAATDLNYKHQKALAEQQNKYNLDMWKLQADYNSPQSQMQRFQAAGLNPNLVYGQGSNGNMTSAPQMVTPNAPDYSKAAQELSKAFYLTNLKKLGAEAEQARQNARNARTDAERNELMFKAERNFGLKYEYDYASGKFVLRPPSPDGEVEFIHPSAYYFNRLLQDDYIRSNLIPSRRALYEAQKNYLAPQIWMANYEKSHYPISYYIGQGTKVLNSLTSIPNTFSPLKWTYRGR